jgi:hypothetical protein
MPSYTALNISYSVKVTTQRVWWRFARATTSYSRFRPREARAETAVSNQPE